MIYTSAPPPPPPPPPPVPSGGKLWGLTYSPYNNDGSCPDLGTVTSQLKDVAKVAENIRLYSTDCSQLSLAMQAISNSKLPLSIHAGIWVTAGDDRVNSDLDAFVAAAKQYDRSLIKGLSVGNEAITNGMSESQLIGYIRTVRSRLQAEGLGGIPVYTTETDGRFSQALADASDLIQVNLQAIFDKSFTSIGASAQSVIDRARAVKANIARGKSVQIGEVGWASAGSTGPCPLTLSNAKQFVQKLKCLAANTDFNYFYFEAKDALWKKHPVLSEQSFGIFTSDFSPKFDFGVLDSC
ncbi:hypothetical protein LPJ61_002509 [Coemansia biformis]|uniref:glucan endo-1,3-beta-D-glucosidase n=1 Tax=Coemansia biformis TaxID=1286918 RepID=A0A9W7YFN6_9FUNG|nr:hypothetical protein LPJ61_002509 [Coemansia biformis]